MEALFEKCNEGSHTPSLHDLPLVLNDFATLGTLDDIFIIADALDECFDDSDREEVLDLVIDISSLMPSNIHILVTSRPHIDIVTKLTPCLTTNAVTIQGVEVDNDIERYILTQLATDSKLMRWSSDVKAEIVLALANGAKGM
jgi:hypothetical protein